MCLCKEVKLEAMLALNSCVRLDVHKCSTKLFDSLYIDSAGEKTATFNIYNAKCVDSVYHQTLDLFSIEVLLLES